MNMNFKKIYKRYIKEFLTIIVVSILGKYLLGKEILSYKVLIFFTLLFLIYAPLANIRDKKK